MKRRLTAAEINHLRRLLGWVSCEIGQSPEELKESLSKMVSVLGNPTQHAQDVMVDMHNKSASVPKYVRAAVKALRRTIKHQDGAIIDGERMEGTARHLEDLHDAEIGSRRLAEIRSGEGAVISGQDLDDWLGKLKQ